MLPCPRPWEDPRVLAHNDQLRFGSIHKCGSLIRNSLTNLPLKCDRLVFLSVVGLPGHENPHHEEWDNRQADECGHQAEFNTVSHDVMLGLVRINGRTKP